MRSLCSLKSKFKNQNAKFRCSDEVGIILKFYIVILHFDICILNFLYFLDLKEIQLYRRLAAEE